MINIAIVIPVHNRRIITIEGLNNLSNSIEFYKANGKSTINLRIIVVDDGSDDGTWEWISKNREDIKLLRGDGNLWWGGSINLGAKFACKTNDCTHVMLWNDDTICNLDYFFELEKAIILQPKLAESILVSKVFWLESQEKLFNFGCMYNSLSGVKTLIGLNESDKYNNINKVDWSGGMGTLIPANIFKETNFIDNLHFPQYHGDIDFFLRAKEKGFTAYAIPTLKIFNNAATTGLVSALKFSDLKRLFRSNSSLHNFKQNIYFNKRHSNTPLSWILFAGGYAKVVLKSII